MRYIIFREKNIWYGVALEFNIVEEGDNPVEVMASLFEAIKGYIETAQRFKMRPMPLNQKSDKVYQYLWDKLEDRNVKKPDKLETIKPEEIHTFGFAPFKNYAPVC